MSTSNSNIPFIIKLDTDLLVGAVIRAGTSGDATKQAARATTALAVLAAVIQINAGDVTDGLAAIDALVTNTKDPATAAAIQTTVTWIASKAQAIQSFLSGSAAGALAATIVGQVVTEAISVAQKYIPATPVAVAA